MSDKISNLVDKRNQLAKQRDRIQQEITDLWLEVQSSVVCELQALGVFKADWILVDDLCASYLGQGQILICHDRELSKKASTLAYQHDFKMITVAPGVRLHFEDCCLKLQFERTTDPRTFVRQNGINVDFSYYDNKIKELQDLKHKWGH